MNDVDGVNLNDGVRGGGHVACSGSLIVITALEVELISKNARTWRVTIDLCAIDRNCQHTVGQRELDAIRVIQSDGGL